MKLPGRQIIRIQLYTTLFFFQDYDLAYLVSNGFLGCSLSNQLGAQRDAYSPDLSLHT